MTSALDANSQSTAGQTMKLGWVSILAMITVGVDPLSAQDASRAKSGIDSIINQPEFKHARWGYLLVDRQSGEVLESLEADKLFIPASTTKLFSCAAALEAIGPDFRFQTPIYKRGRIDEAGTLKGDLILVATGDPTFGGRTTPDGKIAFKSTDHTYEGTDVLTDTDPLAGLDSLARQVAAANIKLVDGEVFVDDRLFRPFESTGSGPKRVWPITINDNVIDIIIQPGEPGVPARVDWRPKSQRITVDADLMTVPSDQKERIGITSHEMGKVIVRGTVRAAKLGEPTKSVVKIIEMDDPPTMARILFIEALHRAGVRTTASIFAPNPSSEGLPTGFPELDRVAILSSPPFAENIKLILKASHNLHASQLPMQLALSLGKNSLEDGLRRQGEILKGLGVPVESISFGGGAGGSPADLVTPSACVSLLRAMARHPHQAAYKQALPILGIDGTLMDSVDRESAAVGRAWAKTGTFWWNNAMNNRKVLTSKGLAGYLTAASGRELVFALYVNYVHLNQTDDRAKVGKTLGKVCELWMSAY
jgi:D-alanyl-D-alanine carboxypeptidase/D-alanyl-D-alanine-endopeptidase (penicillin-binding protein 4)